MAVSAFRGTRLPFFHRSQAPVFGIAPGKPKRLVGRRKSNGVVLLAQYSQAQDLFTSRLQSRIENLPKLVEDIVQTSIDTGPLGALRIVQGIQAVVGVGGEWRSDVSKSTNASGDQLNCSLAATVASQWLELLHQDIRGRPSALRRSRKRVRAVISTELRFLIVKEFPPNQENDPNLLDRVSSTSRAEVHKARWTALFNQMELTLSEEEKKLESWLTQVRELQSHCDQGLQHLSMSSEQNFLQLGMPLDSRSADTHSSEKELAVRAAAASIYSTCNFLTSKENMN